MKILYYTRHESLGASSRYRTLQYIKACNLPGIEHVVVPLFSDDYLRYKYKRGKESIFIVMQCFLRRIFHVLFCSWHFDKIVIEKELLPYFPPVLECLISLLGHPYIVDYDDAIWVNYRTHKNMLVRLLYSNKIKKVIYFSEKVIAGSEYIYRYALGCGNKSDKVYKLPTVVDLTNYSVSSDISTDIFTIGWIGSPSTTQYLAEVKVQINRFLAEFPARLILIGADEQKVKEIGINAICVEWNDSTEAANLAKFTVGIMPLRNTEFEKGKCGFKLIQYMASGKAVLASSLGENSIIVDHGVNGYLIEEHEEWYKYLKVMFKNRLGLTAFGIAGRQKVEASYSLQATCTRYYELITMC